MNKEEWLRTIVDLLVLGRQMRFDSEMEYFTDGVIYHARRIQKRKDAQTDGRE